MLNMIMENINRDQLRERLIDEGYVPEFGLEHTIDNLLGLQNHENTSAAYEMLVEWMKSGKLGKFEPIEGIDRNYLKNILKMKDPAVILAYGALLYDPKRNAVLLKREEKRRKQFKPSKV